jgi:hypothetical protein
MNSYKIKRNSDGSLAESCPVAIGIKIGSFDCTANCPHNQNTKKEIHTHGFDLPFVRCIKITTKNIQQLIFDI